MSKGKDRLRNFTVEDIAAKLVGCSEPLDAKQKAKLSEACDKATREATTVAQWFAMVVGAVGKIAKTALLGLMLVVLVGCGQAPQAVTDASDASAVAVVRFAGNMDIVMGAWEQAFRAEVLKRLNENFADAEAEIATPDPKKAVAEYKALLALREKAVVELDGRVNDLMARYRTLRSDAQTAIELNAAVKRWLTRKVIQPGDIEAMMEVATVLAQQFKGK